LSYEDRPSSKQERDAGGPEANNNSEERDIIRFSNRSTRVSTEAHAIKGYNNWAHDYLSLPNSSAHLRSIAPYVNQLLTVNDAYSCR
jgi:hypothetical protein